LSENFGLFKQIGYFLFKKNMFQALIKYLSRCTCIRKGDKYKKKPLTYVRQKPPRGKSKLKWLKENMRRELDLKRIITKIYAFEKNF
jgi:hypothetical protein